MTWATLAELSTAYGWAVGGGVALGGMISLFNSWRA